MFSDEEIGRAWMAHRPYLIDLAFRMLGDIGAAEDVVQEAFFRLVQSPPGSVNDARGWLIVVTSRLCLDHIKSASYRRERPDDMTLHGYRDTSSASIDPADARLAVRARPTAAEQTFLSMCCLRIPCHADRTQRNSSARTRGHEPTGKKHLRRGPARERPP